MPHIDICIAGAGIIGLSLALELQSRGLTVVVVEAGQPLREASWAAAGMLAAHDPHNPAELSALAELSVSLYPRFLANLESLGGMAVPFQTCRTLQSAHSPGAALNTLDSDSLLFDAAAISQLPSGYRWLDEYSIDPRQLGAAMLAAVAATRIRLLTGESVESTHPATGAVRIETKRQTITANHFIDCTGAWARDPYFRVHPIKGQMLAVALPSSLPMAVTVRTADIYIVPRLKGPMAGHAIIGATVEEAGFDRTVHASQIEGLRQQAIALLPQIARAEVVDSWSGLRPATSDRLPLIGAHPRLPNHWIASGHFRNGILLAPATARVITQLIVGETPATSLEAFAATRVSLREPVRRFISG